MATIKEENVAVKELEVQRDWSDLPIDIAGCIIGKLCWADRLRFRAVCKAWQLPRCLTPLKEEDPWILSFVDEESKKRVIKLFNPYRNSNFVVKEIRGEECEILRGKFWASRYGWVTCSKARNLPKGRYIVETFLFCPFTGEIIEFPVLDIELEEENPWCIPLTSFFMNPDSPECVVYAVWRRVDWVWMVTCSPGDTDWKTFKFPLAGDLPEFLPFGVTYLAGCFYSITTMLEVGVFNLSTHGWQLIKPSGQKPCMYDNMFYYGSMVHSDSDLLWYECENVEGYGDYGCSSVVNLWRFDFSKKCWIKEEFGNWTIFSSQFTTFLASAVGKGREELAGMVFTDDEYVFVKGKSVEPDEGWSYSGFYEWMAEERKSKNLLNMWVDPRPVWRKSELLKLSEEIMVSVTIDPRPTKI